MYKWLLWGGVALMVLGAVWYFVSDQGTTDSDRVAVTEGALTNTVRFSGSVTPAERITLGFETNGRIARIPVDVGDRVEKGDLLATLDDSTTRALLLEARSKVLVEEAALERLRKGPKEEEIELQKTAITNARRTLLDTERTLLTTLQSAYTKSDTAIRGTADVLFSNPRVAPKLTYQVSDSQLVLAIENDRRVFESLLGSWSSTVSGLALSFGSATASPIIQDSAITESRTNLSRISLFLERLALSLTAIANTNSASASDIETWKSSIALARADISSALASLDSAVQSRNNALSTVSVEERELALLESPATPEDVREAEARIAGARASVSRYESDLKTAVLTAPISGIVAFRDGEVGETVTSGNVVITLDTESAFEVDANVSELDIAGISLGQEATITLDAYGASEMFRGEVTSIDPSETLINNVPTYGVTLQFTDNDPRIKIGMTANVSLTVPLKERALIVPGRAVYQKDGRFTVLVYTESGTTERTVTIGIRSASGDVEVLSGLSLGEYVSIPR